MQDIIKPVVLVDVAGIFLHILISYTGSHFLKEEALVIFSTNATLLLMLVGAVIIERRVSNWKLSLDLFKL